MSRSRHAFMRCLPLLCAVLCFVGAMNLRAQETDVTIPSKPAQRTYVCDYANMLAPETTAALQQLGATLQQKTTAELVLVIVPTRGSMDIKTFANRLFNQWGLGTSDKQNGCLLLLVQDNLLGNKSGRARIEVGKGLDGRLNDAKCGRILDSFILPPFDTESTPDPTTVNAGIQNAFTALAQEIADEYDADLAIDKPVTVPQRDETPFSDIIPLAIFGIFFLFSAFLRRGRGYTSTRGGFGGGFGGGFSGGFGGGGGGFGGGSSGGGGADR